MIILGICDSHEAAACLFIDGEAVAACAEERFTRLKCDMGYPYQAVEYCLKQAGVRTTDIDGVAFASETASASHIRMKREAAFSIQDWVDEQNLYWKKKLNGESVSYHKLFSDNPHYQKDQYYDYSGVFDSDGNENQEKFREVRRQTAVRHLDIPTNKVRFIAHEPCHSYYGYFGSELRNRALVFTCEGGGDYSNATVSIAKNGSIKEICRTWHNHLAHMYRYITLLLGMKPNQHEYKVMGLAPYSSDYEKKKSLAVFKDLLRVKDGNLVTGKTIPDRYFYFIESLQGHRFDGVAAALQEFSEDCLKNWVLYHVRQTGIRNIVFVGGVAQNIKAMKALKDLDEIENVYVNPISGDGSLAMGGCYYLSKQLAPEIELKPLSNIYLGPSYGDADIRDALEQYKVREKHRVIESPGADDIAELIQKGRIIARCCGRMEFGQRALGNRSILANPSIQGNVQKINRKIKRRDFWMPFTPSIMEQRVREYVENYQYSPYMTMAFDSTDRARTELIAAIHPADFTVRPQMLRQRDNTGYFEIIEAFEKRTGIGALLNTSLNLHGQPLVCSPQDALMTFENSELDGLVLDTCMILRQSPTP